MDHLPPVDDLSNEELAAHLRTHHALVPRDAEDRDRMLGLHAGGRLAGHAHDLDAAPEPSAVAWRGRVRLSGPAAGSPGFLLVELDDATDAPVEGTVVTVLPGDGLRG